MVTVGRAPSPWQRSFYLALRRGERWQAVAELGVETRAGVGGGWEELTVESVERSAAPGGAVVRIDVRHGFRDRDLRTGAELSFVETRATLCWLPEAPAEAATCPLQVPVAREREELRPDGPEVPERLATRLEIRSGADPRRLEIVLVEGAAAGLEPFLGRHELP